MIEKEEEHPSPVVGRIDLSFDSLVLGKSFILWIRGVLLYQSGPWRSCCQLSRSFRLLGYWILFHSAWPLVGINMHSEVFILQVHSHRVFQMPLPLSIEFPFAPTKQWSLLPLLSLQFLALNLFSLHTKPMTGYHNFCLSIICPHYPKGPSERG